MILTFHRCMLAACLALIVAACSPSESPPPAAPDGTAADASASAPAAGTFDTTVTIREIMSILIDPHADALWDAVRYEIDAAGEQAYLPEGEDDWEALRASALTILEGANALMVPGRRAAPPGATADDPQYEYSPEEVEGRMQAGWSAWVASARALQGSTLQILEAIDARNVDQLFERGGVMFESCESCHTRYWYRQ